MNKIILNRNIKMDHTGLILEGGGLRGVYTSGVLRFLMDKNLWFPYVIGVSMGACNAANYISRQPERNRIVNIRFVNDPRYLSYRRLLTGGDLFGMDFIFDTIPNKIIPFDYETFYKSWQKCITVVTDCISGQSLYFDKDDLGEDYLKILQASSSLPFISKPVRFREMWLMDGGLSDSIPLRKSITDGNQKHVLILTQPENYRKSPQRFIWPARLFYPRFKGLQQVLETRHLIYNRTLELIAEMEKNGDVFVIRPSRTLEARRVERNQIILYRTYDQGYFDGEKNFTNLLEFLS